MSLLTLVWLIAALPVFADLIVPPTNETHTTLIDLAVAVVVIAAAVILWIILQKRRK